MQYKWILILFLALISVRCATTGADWETSRKLNTVCGYQVFLKNHPESEYIRDAKVRIEDSLTLAAPTATYSTGIYDKVLLFHRSIQPDPTRYRIF